MLKTVRATAGRVANDRPRGGRRIPHTWTTIASNTWVERLIAVGDLEVQPPTAPLVVTPQVMPAAVLEDEPGETIVAAPAATEPDVSPESALTQAPAPEPRPAAVRKSKRSPQNGA